MNKTENKAIENLSSLLPGVMACGLNKRIRQIQSQLKNGRKHLEGMENKKHHGFVPDVTRLRCQKALNPAFEPFDYTLELIEIVNTNKISEFKMSKIECFSMDLFDLASVWVELFVCDKDGNNLKKVFDSRSQLCGGEEENKNDAAFI